MTRGRNRRSRVPDRVGGKIFGGPRRTARQFVVVVAAVFALVGILIVQAWERIEMTETLAENRRLSSELTELADKVICKETTLRRMTTRSSIVARAEQDLSLRMPGLADVGFVPDSTAVPQPAGSGLEGGRSR
jgi:hypothetical protein